MSVSPDILCKLQVIADFNAYLDVQSLNFTSQKYFLIPQCL